MKDVLDDDLTTFLADGRWYTLHDLRVAGAGGFTADGKPSEELTRLLADGVIELRIGTSERKWKVRMKQGEVTETGVKFERRNCIRCVELGLPPEKIKKAVFRTGRCNSCQSAVEKVAKRKYD